MVLKPQDVVVLLKLVSIGPANWTHNSLAVQLSMSASEVHAAVKRAQAANLMWIDSGRARPNISNLQEFLVHGLKYVFVPERGELARGIPTGFAAPPLSGALSAGDEPPPVWPDPEGRVRGMAFSPLYKSVPKAVGDDPLLYELLVLVDAIRGGRARERNIAIKELKKRLEKQ